MTFSCRGQVDWALLTSEEAPCHERLSTGELLCELAAAVDYAASGAVHRALLIFGRLSRRYGLASEAAG